MLIVYFLLILGLAVVDQLIKYWAVQELAPVGTIPLLRVGGKDWLQLHYLENDGAAFSSFSGMKWLLIVVTVAMVALCIWLLVRYFRQSRLFGFGCTLAIAGGIGNLIDRLFRGGLVVDYIDVTCISFPVFNFADCCVVVGVILMGIYFIFLADAGKKSQPEKQEQSDG